MLWGYVIMSNQITAPGTAAEANPVAVKTGSRFPKWILPVALGGLVLLLVGFLTYSMTGYDNIYHNVTVGGVNLGGCTREEASAKLESELRKEFEGQVLPMTIGDQTIEITGQQVGVRFQTEKAVDSAMTYGREGGFLKRLGQVTSSLFSTKELPLDTEMYIDTDKVKTVISQAAQELDIQAVPNVTRTAEKEVLITMGKPGRKVDQVALTTLVIDRFTAGDFSPLTYEPMVMRPQPVDVNALYEEVFKEPVDAHLNPENKNEVEVLPEEDGVSFDQQVARTAVDSATPGETVTIPLVFTPAKIDKTMLETQLFRDELSTFTTYLNAGNAPRTSNIRLAASIINGTVLLPGEVFSYNGVVGQRTTERGFKQAGAYVQGRLVDEVGGGICQMSTTLYGGVVRANLKIVERRNHSMTVAYVPVGQDATVNWGTTDLKFENNTPYPIQINAEQSGGYVKVTILGTKTDENTVSFESRVLSTTPFSVKKVVNNSLAPGARKVVMEGHTGYSAESYRVIKDKDGKEISRTVEATSKYSKADQIVEVGPSGTSNQPADTNTPPADTNTPPAETPAPPAEPGGDVEIVE